VFISLLKKGVGYAAVFGWRLMKVLIYGYITFMIS
jgi:hypothetical protein